MPRIRSIFQIVGIVGCVVSLAFVLRDVQREGPLTLLGGSLAGAWLLVSGLVVFLASDRR